tara:strand:- start:8194 stop:8862 length:669 start_codon:yes stop_codon:yes gene_type:complete
MSNDIFWLNDPMLLINSKTITQLWPNKNMSDVQKLNSLVRLVIFLTIILFVLFQNTSHIYSGVLTIFTICLYYFFFLKEKKVEPYEGFESNIKADKKKVQFEKIKDKNPMNNVLVTDYTGNPNKKSAPPAYEPNVVEEINKQTKSFIKSSNSTNTDIDKRLFKDLGDNYMFEDSMHRFISNPSTTNPNDQEGFAKFCYGDMVSAKEGDKFAAGRNAPRYTNY